VSAPDVRIGALVHRLHDGRVLAGDADTVMSLASVGKLLVLGEVACRIAAGTLDPDRPVPVTDEDRRVGGTGILGRLSHRDWTVADLVTAVAAVSDNAATNALLRVVTLESVQELARRLGLRATTVHDRIRSHRGPGVPPQFATGTARELCAFMATVATGSLHGPEASGLMREWLALNTDRSLVADSVRHDPWAADGVRVLSKTGVDDGVRAEAGIVLGRATVVYAVLGRVEVGAERAAVEELRRWGDVVDRFAAGFDELDTDEPDTDVPDTDVPDAGSGQRSANS
jgi:beta-lactamase class A